MITTADLSAFLAVSERLLGLAPGELSRRSALAAAHLALVEARAGRERLARLLDGGEGEEQAALRRSLLKLWYLGLWVQPFDHADWRAGERAVASLDAYRGALVWDLLGATAPGIGAGDFGAWARPPTEEGP